MSSAKKGGTGGFIPSSPVDDIEIERGPSSLKNSRGQISKNKRLLGGSKNKLGSRGDNGVTPFLGQNFANGARSSIHRARSHNREGSNGLKNPKSKVGYGKFKNLKGKNLHTKNQTGERANNPYLKDLPSGVTNRPVGAFGSRFDSIFKRVSNRVRLMCQQKKLVDCQ